MLGLSCSISNPPKQTLGVLIDIHASDAMPTSCGLNGFQRLILSFRWSEQLPGSSIPLGAQNGDRFLPSLCNTYHFSDSSSRWLLAAGACSELTWWGPEFI